MRYAAWAVLLVAGAGCQSPRVVQRAGDEGIVAIPDSSDRFPHYHHSAAQKLIREHVGPDFEIIEEKEVTTGYATTNTVEREGELPFALRERERTQTTTVATPQKEWQIHYRRVMPKPALPGDGVVQTQYVPGPRLKLPEAGPPAN